MRNAESFQRNQGIASSSISLQPTSLNFQYHQSYNKDNENAIETKQGRSKSVQDINSQKNHHEKPPNSSVSNYQFEPPSGLENPRLKNDGLISPDFLEYDPDDLSTDSYLIDKESKESKESKTIPDSSLSLIESKIDDILKKAIDEYRFIRWGLKENDKKIIKKENGNKGTVESGKNNKETDEIEYTLHKHSVKRCLEKPKHGKDIKKRRAVSASRVSCRMNHRKHDYHESSPTLYSQTEMPKKLDKQSKHYFVSVHNLPSLESYSYRDDTDSENYDVLENVKSYFIDKMQNEAFHNKLNGVIKGNQSAGLYNDIKILILNKYLTETSEYIDKFSFEFNKSDVQSQLSYKNIKSQDSFSKLDSTLNPFINDILKMYLVEHLPDDFDKVEQMNKDNGISGDDYDLSRVNLAESPLFTLQKIIIKKYLTLSLPDDFDKSF